VQNITEKELKEYNKELNIETIRNFSSRISGNIEFTWGYKECEEYMNNLLNDNPDGIRQGFPPEVGYAMMNLLRQHQEEYEF
jgi:hypothetical protein